MKNRNKKGESVMRKSTSIMGLLLVALFALSTFAPLSNAAYTHQDLTLTVIINGNDITQYNTKDNPLTVNVDDAINVHLAIQNNGETVHLTDMSMEIYTVQRILGIWDWEVKIYTHQVDVDNSDEDGDGKEGFDILAGLDETDSFTVAAEEIAEYKEEVRGQSVRLDVIFNFETIPDFTATVYIDFV
jgi:hypothetical protein